MKFSTAEKFLIIAHHPEKGRFVIDHIHLEYGIIGSMLLDMSLDENIVVEDGKLLVKKDKNAEKNVNSEVMSLIINSPKLRKLSYWISRLSRKSRKYKWIILSELAGKRIMRIEERKFLNIIPFRKSYLSDRSVRDRMIQQLKYNILFHKELTDENVAICGMIEACKMYKTISGDKDELQSIKRELKKIINESPIAETVGQTIRQVQAAIIVSMITATAASSGARH